MSVNYYVTKVPFELAEFPCAAHVTGEESLSDEQLVDRMDASGSGFTRSNIKGVMELFRKVVLDAVREGKGIHTRLFAGGFSVEGGMPDQDALFNPERNTFRYNLSAGPDVVAAAKEAHPQKVPGPNAGPLILHVHDQSSGTTDGKITSGGNVRITGKRLRVAGTDPYVGVGIVREGGWTAYVDLNELVVNKPGELIFRVPDLIAGPYCIRIVTQDGNGKLLKTPHTGFSDKVLTAVIPPTAAGGGQGTDGSADRGAAAIEAPAAAKKTPARKSGASGGASAR
jgi:hypothetical protein